jgi:hypothetical protein
LQDYLQTVADEALLAQSSRVARRAKFRADDADALVRQHRAAKRNAG